MTPGNCLGNMSYPSDEEGDPPEGDPPPPEEQQEQGGAKSSAPTREIGRTDMMNSIETDLENVEQQLRQESVTARTAGSGRAVFNSIQTALGSIRSRLQTVREDEQQSVAHEIPTRADDISERLRNAEIAHSARVPLGVLQSELSRRSQGTSSSEINDPFREKEEEEQKRHDSAGSLSSRLQSSRRASVLLASRRSAEVAQGPQADMDLHGTANSILQSPLAEAKRTGSMKSTEDMELDLQEEEEGELIDEREVPILLSQISHKSLDSARRSILFSQQAEALVETTTTSAATIVYSWGSGINSLHAGAEDVTVEHSQVDPKSRVGRNDVLSAAAGHQHAACSTTSGEVLVCGLNTTGAVNPDCKDEKEIPQPVLIESLGQARIVQVSCGFDHTAALRANGAVMTWGSNEYGQLGHRQQADGEKFSTFCRPAIMALGAGRRATSVACGDGFTIVLTSRMTLLVCGEETISGYNTSGGARHLPAPISALEDLPIVSIAAGRRHAVAITANGTAFAWGENSHGCCGREYPKKAPIPVPVRVPASSTQPVGPRLPEPLSNWAYWKGESVESHASLADDVAIVNAACGDSHTVFVTRSGRLLVCGSNSQGQLGLANVSKDSVYTVEPLEHQDAASGRSFVQAQAGEAHTLLLDDAGDVWQLGGGIASGHALVLQGKDIQWIAAGGKQSIAVAYSTDLKPPRREFSSQSCEDEATLVESVEELLRALPEDKKTKSNEEEAVGVAATELAARTEELLRTPAVLNSLFLDPTELEDLFSKLLNADSKKFRQTIASAIEKGMQRGLESLYADCTRLMYPEQVRFLLLYIQCPLFLQWNDEDIVFDRRGDLILLLCETILGLTYEGYKALLSWATSIYPKDLFVRLLIRPLLAQLEKGISAGAGAETRPIPAIVAVLRWLYNASERAGNIAKPPDFYSDAVGKMEAERLLEDLFRFKKASKHERSADFFFCANSFLFSPTTKRNLLLIENEMTMLQTAASGLTYNILESAFEFNPFYVLEIDRQDILNQTLQKIEKADQKDLRKKLRVVFKGEDGVDAGGVTREYFQLLSEQLFDANTGMWSTRVEGITWFNSECSWNDEGFFLCGVLVGLAVYNGVLLDVHFPQAVYRKLLGLPLGLEDMVDEEVKKGLRQLLEYDGDDVEDIFCLTFDVNWMDLGQEKRRELKPGGSEIPVTANNKEEYAILYVQWLLETSIYPQYEAFERGFLHVMGDSTCFEMLSAEELELLVVGTPELDFEALEKNAEYEGGYSSESDVVRNFWRFVKNASPDSQVKFLKFTTGSPKAPIGGLGNLSFKIQRAGPDSMQLPTSHTCFNTLLLPDYGDNYERLEERLGRAIIECEGFGLQ